MLNLPKLNTATARYTRVVKDSTLAVAEESMFRATEETVEFNEDHNRDLEVAHDGTWQKRGFKTKNGVCSLTSLDTGEVLDVEVLTKYCSGCEKATVQ